MTALLVSVLAIISFVAHASERLSSPTPCPWRTALSVEHPFIGRASSRFRPTAGSGPELECGIRHIRAPHVRVSRPAVPRNRYPASPARHDGPAEKPRCDWCRSVASARASLTPGSARCPQTLDNRAKSARLSTPLTPPATSPPDINPHFRSLIVACGGLDTSLNRGGQMISTHGQVWSFRGPRRSVKSAVSTTCGLLDGAVDFRNSL